MLYKVLLAEGAYGNRVGVREFRGTGTLAVNSRSTVYIGAMDSFWVSRNGGDTWSVVNHGLDDVLAIPGSPAWEDWTRTFYDIDVSDPGGVVWAATRRGLYALCGDRWHKVTPDDVKDVHRVTLIGDDVFYQAAEGVFCLDQKRVEKYRRSDAGKAWAVQCKPEYFCSIHLGKLVVSPGSRGSIECSPWGDWLACLYSHTTNMHLQEGWFIHIQSEKATKMRLPSTMTSKGLVRVIGPPIWEGNRVRMTVASGKQRRIQYWEIPQSQ
jgi:hypothetical protein